MHNSPDDDLIVNFIRGYTQPVQWVGWWYKAVGSPAADSLGSILFEPDGERLRDLTTPGIREELICAVLASESLRQVVGKEVEQFLDLIAERSVGLVAERSVEGLTDNG